MEMDFENSINIIERQFLCCHELTKADWDLIPEELSLEKQKLLFDRVHNNELNKKYPISYEYQMEFYKRYIQHLELTWLEVHDDIYYGFCDFEALNKQNNEKSFYRHYCLPKYDTVISVKEIRSYTVDRKDYVFTELYRWQGSVALSDWLLHHEDVVQEKSVLELGAQTGLCGIIALKCCKAENVILTNPSLAVCENLYSNKDLNIKSVKNAEGKVSVVQLPWDSCDLVQAKEFDVILAPDVAIDSTEKCNKFIETVDRLFRLKDDKVSLVMSVTVEYERQLKDFLSLLQSNCLGVQHEQVIPLEQSLLYWHRSTPIQIMTITRTVKCICTCRCGPFCEPAV